MRQVNDFGYVDDGQAQIVALPLAGGTLTVVLALPHGDLATYEASLAASSAALKVPASDSSVILSLPKLSFTTPTFSLADALKAMGMNKAFDQTAADFTGLCAAPPDGGKLYVGDVMQKAMVAMDDSGVEAAAATAVIGVTAGLPGNSVEVNLNRPFLVTIVDEATGAVLFLGHVTDPTDAGSP
jgi:serpin B